jgi:hypothetical protein
MYGLVGLVAFGTILLLPVERAVWPPAGASPRNEPNLRLAMAALILMVAIDNLLNGAMILPYLLIMGGLAAGSRNCTEALAAKIETDTNVASISH